MPVALIIAVASALWLLYSWQTRPKLKQKLPHVRFNGDNSRARYQAESGKILSKGYAQYITKGLPFCMRDPTDPKKPMFILPFRYLNEVKWRPEHVLSMWRHIDKQSILSKIGGPAITQEVANAARQGLNRALVYLIEPLHRACLAAYAKEMPPCPEWTPVHPYPLILKVFASMSALVMVGPELGGLDSEWQSLSMGYVAAALTGPGQVRNKYPTWLYWLSRYTNDAIKTMWRHRCRAGELLAPVLQARIDATEELKAQGIKPRQGQRKFEDGVQWLYDAHAARGKKLTPDQLTQDLFVIMTASIHSTTGAGLAMLFDMIEHPVEVAEIRNEIVEVQSQHPTWTRQALGELRILDSFMRESSRLHALTQLTNVNRVAAAPFTFKDGLAIPSGATLGFPSYHHNVDAAVNPHPDAFDAKRHLRKREEEPGNAHRFHFASATDDMINFGTGRHACPGRFFAQETLKLMLIHLLTSYEFKHAAEETKETPRYVANNLFLVPNPKLPVLFRVKKMT